MHGSAGDVVSIAIAYRGCKIYIPVLKEHYAAFVLRATVAVHAVWCM